MNDLSHELRTIEKLASSGDYSGAIQRLDRLGSGYPNDAKVFASRAYVVGRQLGGAAAIADWSKAIALNDKEPHYFYMRGVDLFQLQRFQEAILDFTKVIELCDYYRSDYYRSPAYLFRADAYVRLKEFEKAKADCERISDDMRTRTDKLRCKADILAECIGH